MNEELEITISVTKLLEKVKANKDRFVKSYDALLRAYEKKVAQYQNQVRTKQIEVEKAQRELDSLQGKYGVCKKCGKEGRYYAWDETQECSECAEKRRQLEYRPKYQFLIGRKIVDIEVETTLGELWMIILDDGTKIKPSRDYDGDVHLTTDK